MALHPESLLLDEIQPQSILVGPGFTDQELESSCIQSVIQYATTHHIPMVLDAGVLYPQNLTFYRDHRNESVVFKPHLGEVRRLLEKELIESDRVIYAKELLGQYASTWVLKGPASLIVFEQVSYTNTSGGPMLATAGSGDVLAGMILALLAQGLNADAAAALGVYAHGLEAELASEHQSDHALLASQLIDCIGKVLKDIQSEQT